MSLFLAFGALALAIGADLNRASGGPRVAVDDKCVPLVVAFVVIGATLVTRSRVGLFGRRGTCDGLHTNPLMTLAHPRRGVRDRYRHGSSAVGVSRGSIAPHRGGSYKSMQ